MYNCPKCKTDLIRGREYQYPPRLFYWYCPKCQRVHEEHGEVKKTFRCIGDVSDHKSKCIQDINVCGYVENTLTGEKTYSNIPMFNKQSRLLIKKVRANV